jgi:hypothetical protein
MGIFMKYDRFVNIVGAKYLQREIILVVVCGNNGTVGNGTDRINVVIKAIVFRQQL